MGDTRKFKAWLRRLGPIGRAAGFAEVVASGAAIANNIQANAPVKSGRLRSSVRMEIESGRFRVVIKAGGPATTVPVRSGQTTSYDYALAQEFGTQHVRAQPFFYPTWRIGRRAARPRIFKAIKQALESEND